MVEFDIRWYTDKTGPEAVQKLLDQKKAQEEEGKSEEAEEEVEEKMEDDKHEVEASWTFIHVIADSTPKEVSITRWELL